MRAQSLGLTNWNNTASENLNGPDLFSPSSIFSLINNCRARYTIQLTEITLSIDSSNGAFSIIVFTPSEENAANNPVPITTPKRCGYVSLIPNLAPEIVKRIMLGPGVNKPTNTKTNNGKKSEIKLPQNFIFPNTQIWLSKCLGNQKSD